MSLMTVQGYCTVVVGILEAEAGILHTAGCYKGCCLTARVK